MPVFHRLMRVITKRGPVWDWSSAFVLDQQVVLAAHGIATSGSTFLDTPTGVSAGESVVADAHSIVASGFVGLDTPLDGGTSTQNVTMDAHGIATTASVALV